MKMKKQITAGISVIACAAMCAAVWPRRAEVGDFPAEPVKTAVTAEIEARAEKIPLITLSADAPAPEVGVVAENEPPNTDLTAEEKQNQHRRRGYVRERT